MVDLHSRDAYSFKQGDILSAGFELIGPHQYKASHKFITLNVKEPVRIEL